MKKLFSVRTILLAGSLLLQLSTLCFQSRGAAGDVDLSFDPGSSVNGTVNAVVVQPNGKVLIAGQFTTVKGLVRPGLARLNADGSGDSSFNPGTGANDDVVSVASQPDGKVLIVGSFTAVNGTNRGAIARLNADGTLDSSFNPNLASVVSYDGIPHPHGGEHDIAATTVLVQTDGKVLIAGYTFTLVTGEDVYSPTVRYFLVRFNADGSFDPGFTPVTGSQTDWGGWFHGWSTYPASALAVRPDGKVVVSGVFSSINGTNRNGMARLNANGSLDGTFNPGTEVYGSVSSVAPQADGKIVIGGGVLLVNGTNFISWIARLNANGSLDPSFAPVIGKETSADSEPVRTLALQPNGKVVVAGSFISINGTNRNGIARLMADGSLDSSFDPGAGSRSIRAIALQPDGNVLIGGSFTTVNGTNRNAIARLNANGSLDGSFNPGTGLDGAASFVTVQPDGKLLVGGPFTYNPNNNVMSRSWSARLNADGSLDGTFIPGSFHPNIGVISSEFDYNVVTAVAEQSDGKVLIGGYSVHWDCDPESCNVWAIYFLDRVNADGSRDPGFFYPSRVDYEAGWDNWAIKSIVVQSDGKVLIGNSPTVNGTNYGGVVRLNSNGSLDGTAVTPGLYSKVTSVVVQSDGKLLIVGSFTNVNGSNRNGIARLNANESLDASFNPGTGVSGGSVSSIALQPDDKVLIGGSFTNVNGTNRNHIARLNANGTLDTSFNPGAGADAFVGLIALQSDGKVLIGGVFFTVNGVPRPYVARLYGDSIAPPSLSIVRSNSFVIATWPVTTGFVLDQSLTATGVWSQVAFPYSTNGNLISIISVPANSGNKFYRLRKL